MNVITSPYPISRVVVCTCSRCVHVTVVLHAQMTAPVCTCDRGIAGVYMWPSFCVRRWPYRARKKSLCVHVTWICVRGWPLDLTFLFGALLVDMFTLSGFVSTWVLGAVSSVVFLCCLGFVSSSRVAGVGGWLVGVCGSLVSVYKQLNIASSFIRRKYAVLCRPASVPWGLCRFWSLSCFWSLCALPRAAAPWAALAPSCGFWV